MRESIAKLHVPRADYELLEGQLEESQAQMADLRNQLEVSLAHSNELENQLETANQYSNQLQAELDDVHSKLASTYTVLEEACTKIDHERSDFEKSLRQIRRTTEGEIRKNSELYAKTLAMEETYVAQRQALDTKTDELKQLEKRLNKQEERANNRINKLAVKLEQEKFISREIVQPNSTNVAKAKSKK